MVCSGRYWCPPWTPAVVKCVLAKQTNLTPHTDTGDFVIVINAESKWTGKKRLIRPTTLTYVPRWIETNLSRWACLKNAVRRSKNQLKVCFRNTFGRAQGMKLGIVGAITLTLHNNQKFLIFAWTYLRKGTNKLCHKHYYGTDVKMLLHVRLVPGTGKIKL